LLSLAINHMTSPGSSFEKLLELAVENDCDGVEVRNDLAEPIFSGADAAAAGAIAKAHGVRILGIAQLNEFNCVSASKIAEAEALIQQAVESNAEAICLIPRNDGQECQPADRIRNLRNACLKLAPLLRSSGIRGMIEPLGFITSSIRSKAEVAEVITELEVADCFSLVHDTFHHFVAAEKMTFSQLTGIVHVSGVTDTGVAAPEMNDTHRGLVDNNDRLDNVGQLKALIDGGYSGCVSMEAFAPQVHAATDLNKRLSDSFNYLISAVNIGSTNIGSTNIGSKRAEAMV